MPIVNEKMWHVWQDQNQDEYGGACVKVAARVMELLDENPGGFDCHGIISKADHESNAGGITGNMAAAVAHMVSECHSRGEEFRRKWNLVCEIGDEGKKANDSGGILNPAVLIARGEKGEKPCLTNP